ncbi:unnamed protein product [Durusdinium trenchii]|uniref:Uncharacterized protein n=1 Tax=Durusdinium trenchii TaxID=1381693 RepID=A0ABP0SZF1_9DINO
MFAMWSASLALAAFAAFGTVGRIGAATNGTGQCFQDGIPETLRKELVNGEEAYPIGLWINAWNAGYVMAEVVEILIQEKLGYRVQKLGPGPSTPDGLCWRMLEAIAIRLEAIATLEESM